LQVIAAFERSELPNLSQPGLNIELLNRTVSLSLCLSNVYERSERFRICKSLKRWRPRQDNFEPLERDEEVCTTRAG